MGRKVTLGYPKRLYNPASRPQPKPFRFVVRFRQRMARPEFGPDVTALALDEPMEIQGRPAGSKEEFFVYRALRALGVSDFQIHYQVPWHGGRSLGGQVLDFVLTIGGAPTALRVMGKYWHPGEYGTAKDSWSYGQLSSEGYIVKDIPTTNIKSTGDAIHVLNSHQVV